VRIAKKNLPPLNPPPFTQTNLQLNNQGHPQSLHILIPKVLFARLLIINSHSISTVAFTVSREIEAPVHSINLVVSGLKFYCSSYCDHSRATQDSSLHSNHPYSLNLFKDYFLRDPKPVPTEFPESPFSPKQLPFKNERRFP